MAVTVAVVKETAPNERRVAISPEVVKKLAKLGAKVVIQTGAGDPTHQPDSLFGDVSKADDARGALGQADVVFKVAPPTLDEIAAMKEGAIYVGML
ncbi:MAG TPA: NAD(P)(+) transhydrogenase (Re/Si-specific) subunit alpha, partial [Thermomonas sp.]|nr:NAD(P)(+) transhydrogenase (Re/Si-specific) subunit alpha [Thermomonas sp.]